MKKLYVGIDPGVSGALAGIDDQSQVIFCQDMPTLTVGKSKRIVDGKEVCNTFRWIHGRGFYPIFALENVHSMRGQGVVSTGTFMKAFGIVEGILIASGVRYSMPTPQDWKRIMVRGMPKGKDSSLVRVHQLWPQYPIGKNHNKADALLMAEWARREELGQRDQ